MADRVDKVMTAARPALTGALPDRARMACAGNGVIQAAPPRQALMRNSLASLTKPGSAILARRAAAGRYKVYGKTAQPRQEGFVARAYWVSVRLG